MRRSKERKRVYFVDEVDIIKGFCHNQIPRPVPISEDVFMPPGEKNP
jgi:hypothetical protein